MSSRKKSPKSIRQKRILSIAVDNPEASLEEIASEIATVTPEAVEKVLEEFGDPAQQEATVEQSAAEVATSDGGSPISKEGGSPSVDDSTNEHASPSIETQQPKAGGATHADQPSLPTPESLTPKQRETLEAIRANPDATQRELAEILDVSAPTVSNRVNAIPDFDWAHRMSFVDAVLGSDTSTAADVSEATEITPGDADSENTTEATEDDSSVESKNEASEGGSDGNGERTTESAAETGDATPASERSEDAGIDPAKIERLIRSINDLQTRLDEGIDGPEGRTDAADTDSGEEPFDDPELAHKVIHACMETEKISEDEELEIIKGLL